MKLQLTALFLLVNLSIVAQTYISIPWREGTIIKNGKDEAGMIRLGGDFDAPWLNHSKVYYVTSEVFAAEKKNPSKKVTKEFEAEDIQGYSTYTVDDNEKRIDLHFISAEIEYMDGLAKKKENVFLQLHETGAVNIYTFIPMADNYWDDQQRHQSGQQAINQTITFLRKGDGAYVTATGVELSDLLSECPEVVNKIKSGSYGFADLSQRPKKRGLGNLMAAQAGNNELERKICLAVSDYNRCVK